MDRIREISQTQRVMAFVATCIEASARTLQVPYREVFDRMMRVGLIERYIVPYYGTLHTMSRENVVDDVLGCLSAWEERLCHQ